MPPATAARDLIFGRAGRDQPAQLVRDAHHLVMPMRGVSRCDCTDRSRLFVETDCRLNGPRCPASADVGRRRVLRRAVHAEPAHQALRDHADKRDRG